MKQIDIIENKINGKTHRLEIDKCGHSPHVDFPNLITNKIIYFTNNFQADTDGKFANAIATSLSS